MSEVVAVTGAGLCCARGGFHVDPWRPVPTAVITHAHADHARPGSAVYHAAAPGVGLLRRRLGADAVIHGHGFGEPFRLGDGATVSLHPAGHVLGSAQVRIEADGGGVWVISGDYKRDADPSCEPFEVVPCDAFITEATFALPIYRWDPFEAAVEEIVRWWDGNAAAGRPSVLFAYALGKAQRLLAGLHERAPGREVHTHGAVEPLVRVYRERGVALPPTVPVAERTRRGSLRGGLILAPPLAFGSPWMRRFDDASTGFASGWMRVRGARRRRGFDRGFVVSDHADWPGLIRTVEGTGARRVYATHGYADALARYLREERGLRAAPLDTLFEGESED